MTACTYLTFKSEEDADRAVKLAGFSIAPANRDDPRGMTFGVAEVPKWRNVAPSKCLDFHAIYKRAWEGGIVSINTTETCPANARAILIAAHRAVCIGDKT